MGIVCLQRQSACGVEERGGHRAGQEASPLDSHDITVKPTVGDSNKVDCHSGK